MLFPSWLRNWKGCLQRRSTRSQARRRRSSTRRFAPRLFLEALEDRVVPASLDYFSTSLNATIYATAVDSQGDMYVTGVDGSNLPTIPGAFQTSGSGAFVAKLSPTGAVIYATYLGSGGDGGTGIAVDAVGDAYVIAESGTVPMTANAIAASTSGSEDFVAELNPTGSALNYATYLPGTIDGLDNTFSLAGAIALDSSGNIYVAGQAGSGLPVTASAFQSTPVGGDDPFFMKINPTLSGAASVVYASYLGGSSGVDAATGIAVDGAGNAYLEGYTYSTNFPTTSGAFQTSGAGPGQGACAFVAKFDPALSGAASLVYSTYLGGTTTVSGVENNGSGYVPNEPGIVVSEIAGGIAVDSQGDAYVTSATSSTNFPTTPGAYQTTSNLHTWSGAPATESDVFVTKLNATGSALVYSTYLGGGPNGSIPNSSGGASIAVDANGDAYVTGWTTSTSFPTKNPVQSTSNGAGYDSFVTELNPSGSGLLFSTYLGNSSSNDYDGYGIALDSSGNVYVGGAVASAGSGNIPSSGFASKVNLAPSPSFAVSGFPSPTTAGVAHTVTVTALNANGTVNTGYTGTVSFSSSDPQAVLPANYTFTAADQGVYTFTVTLKTAGSQSITVTDTSNGSIIGSESGITVSPAAASQVVFTQVPSSGTAGQTLGTVQAAIKDAYGNVETADNNDQITVSVNSGPSTQLGGSLTAMVQAGIATFSNLLLDTSGSYTLAAQANLSGGGTLGPVVSSSIAVASPVSLSFGSITYSSKTGLYSETVTLTNTTNGTLTGPMSLELTNLPSGVVLTDATGTTNGNPYVRFLASGKTLKKGASTSITLTFTAASLSDITFGTEVVVGL